MDVSGYYNVVSKAGSRKPNLTCKDKGPCYGTNISSTYNAKIKCWHIVYLLSQIYNYYIAKQVIILLVC